MSETKQEPAKQASEASRMTQDPKTQSSTYQAAPTESYKPTQTKQNEPINGVTQTNPKQETKPEQKNKAPDVLV